MKPFGKVLREERTKAGRTLEDLANLLHVSIPYVSDVERGNRAPLSQERILAIASYLQIKPDPLLDSAAESRGAFELDATLTDRHRVVGAALMRGWAEFTPEELDQINRVVTKKRDRK